MLARKKISLIHVAKSRLGMADDDYRTLLRREAGVSSSRDLDQAGFAAVMDAFKRLGFESKPKPKGKGPEYGERYGFASPAQLRLIRDLWADYTDGAGDDRSLGKWLERVFDCSALRFLTYAQAPKAITALMNMVRRKRGAAA